MKTTEERFNEFAQIASVKEGNNEYHFGKACWLQSATEQRAIDDAELHQRFEKVLNGQKWDLIDKAVAWVDHNIGTITAIALRKAMEKEI